MSARYRILLGGAVQGVGFRPFVYRTATSLNLKGFVANTSAGLAIEIEGEERRLRHFLDRLKRQKPPIARVDRQTVESIPATGDTTFAIDRSQTSDDHRALVLPDLAMCRACRDELFEIGNRRYRYPFTSCMHCGPRYSIVTGLPYDRERTTMVDFPMCGDCSAEFHDPDDRRFHAQPIACPTCGPSLWAVDGEGAFLANGNEALRIGVDALRKGRILALKGLGGFQLICRADLPATVTRLREGKRRPTKPLALMCRDVHQASEICRVSPSAREALESWRAPILLLPKRSIASLRVAAEVAPTSSRLGVMLPNTPLHHLLLTDMGMPLVVTSGNVSDEPLCYQNREILSRLTGVADVFLLHDRRIANPVDDSVVIVDNDHDMVLRRARGYTPMPLPGPEGLDGLAFGGDLKNAGAVVRHGEIFLLPHQGDMAGSENQALFQANLDRFEMFATKPKALALHDCHPDYHTTRMAQSFGVLCLPLQHHRAHAMACLADNELEPPVLAVVWDGAGYGDDGTIWGGEFFHVSSKSIERVAHLRHFPLPGGDKAALEPRRAALGLLHECLGDDAFEIVGLKPLAAFDGDALAVLRSMLWRRIRCPITSSIGRLFDAVSALCGLCMINGHEGMAASLLESKVAGDGGCRPYAFTLVCDGGRPFVLDWEPMLLGILEDLTQGMPVSEIAARFHVTLAVMVLRVAETIGIERVLLSGGCFQNATLCRLIRDQLEPAGFRVFGHRRVPPNDGGLAYGQAWLAARQGGGSCV
ncbi:Carbamoyltransferase [Sulfidibacter corallicola]|uniref:Carbamoyltransferase n=1 Tax=Sulfidibacter corallicola TaxID=2818388 RepID=A0A8A4TWA3_SULCO|nr:carbamoyltransferase HypF [Sulfidibacter corallicola]QTD53637.1 carbamoyltransferase HypF [Sulfidibacter corallicola]